MANRRTRRGGKSRRRSTRRGGDFLGLRKTFTTLSNKASNLAGTFGRKAKGLASGIEGDGKKAFSSVDTTFHKVSGGRRRTRRGGSSCGMNPLNGGWKSKKRHHRRHRKH